MMTADWTRRSPSNLNFRQEVPLARSHTLTHMIAFMRRNITHCRGLAILALLFLARGAVVADESVVEIEAVAGLRYDPVRFQVAPKSAVRLVFRNADDMAHNLVFTKPGTRIEVVN